MPAEYYLGNGWFLLKMFAFGLAAVLSVFPTLQYRRWLRDSTSVPRERLSMVRTMVWLELALVAVIVVAATNVAWER